MPNSVKHLNREELETGLTQLASPQDDGVLDLIVRRPTIGAREVLATGALDLREGLVGDNWMTRGSSRTPDKTSHPHMQLNVMNSQVIQLIAQQKERWPLAGDQLFVDLDLSDGNLPPGTRLVIGTAIIEVTPEPHTGCAKFVERFGVEAMKFVNSPTGRALRLRGLNARVVQPGTIRVGDPVKKS
jgi:MOSC domain-containing protein YiiM